MLNAIAALIIAFKYGPAIFGNFTLAFSFISFLTILYGFKIDVNIYNSTNIDQAKECVNTSLYFAVPVFLFILILFYIFDDPNLGVIIPVASFGMFLTNLICTFYIYEGKYLLSSFLRITPVFLFFNYVVLIDGPSFLIYAYCISQLAVLPSAFKFFNRNIKNFKLSWVHIGMYKGTILYYFPAVLIDSFIPFAFYKIVGDNYGPDAIGLLAIAIRLCAAPTQFIAQPIIPIISKCLAACESKTILLGLYNKYILRALIFYFLFILFCFLAITILSNNSYISGHRWFDAIEYVKILIYPSWFAFSISFVSYVYIILNLQKINIYFAISGLMIKVVPLIALGSSFQLSNIVIMISIFEFVHLSVYWFLPYRLMAIR